MSTYEVIDVTDWELLRPETMGSKPEKQWLREPGNAGPKWLFKPVTTQNDPDGPFLKGDDWAEKIATEVAIRLGLSVAEVRLASRARIPGTISKDISEGGDLVLGNVVLYSRDRTYPLKKAHSVDGYSVDAVKSALTAMAVRPPRDFDFVADAFSAFATYLGLDALIGNTDRHHENWGILIPVGGRVRELAPTFDHASSLGFQLAERAYVARTKAGVNGKGVLHYAKSGRSRHFQGRPSLVDLSASCLSQAPEDVRASFTNSLEVFQPAAIADLVNRVPMERMSQACRTFVTELLVTNRRRLLDELNSR